MLREVAEKLTVLSRKPTELEKFVASKTSKDQG